MQRKDDLHELGKVQIVTRGGQILVLCPYSAEFNEAAKTLNGRWHRDIRRWVFSILRRDAVRELVTRIYGKAPNRRCQHTYLKVAGGIKCMYCGLFKERSL